VADFDDRCASRCHKPAMYERFFGLTEPPFSIAPDPRYLYMSEKHREALAHLLYGINHGGFVLLTGEVGTGKTTICRCLFEQLPPQTALAFVFNPKLTAVELLQTLCDEFRIDQPPMRPGAMPSIKALIDRINAHLLLNHARGFTSVLVIDEAQNLSADVLEQMRLLTNLETNERKLLQVIMIGQPELRTLLQQPNLRQLAQRITARYHLSALDASEVAAYVARRLEVAGVERPLFPPEVIARLHRLTGGVPRLVNILADRALLGAYVQGESHVTRRTLDRAAAEIFDDRANRKVVAIRRAAMGGGALAAAALAALSFASPQLTYGVESLWRAASLAPVAPNATAAGPTVEVAPTAASSPSEAQPPALAQETLAADVAPPILLARTVINTGDEARTTASVVVGASDLIATDSEAVAFAVVLNRWGIAYQPGEGDPCTVAAAEGFGCLSDSGTLTRLVALNRPAVIRLKPQSGRPRYTALLGLSGEDAVLAAGGETQRVAATALAAEWTGHYTVLWRMPPGYRRPIAHGSEGTAVAWLAKRVNEATGNASTPPQLVFDDALRQRVQRFQANHALPADGIAGPLTLIAVDAASDRQGPRLAAVEP
jgi:general secretion pathway protein A